MSESVTIILAAGIPSAITGFCFWLLEHKIQKRDAKNIEEQQHKDEINKKQNVLILKQVSASLALGEATAKAVQKIPDSHCNGDMHQALEYAQNIKHEYKDFLTDLAADSMSDTEN